MKPLVIKEQKNAKVFLSRMVPDLLRCCNIQPVQSFLGFKVNLEAEAQKRIAAMTESQAKWTLDALKEIMEEW